MSITNKALSCLSLLLLAFSPLLGKEDHRVEIQPKAFKEASALPNQGILKQKENGFVYLDVPNEYITEVAPLLDHPGHLNERLTTSRSMGAHISVFHEKENIVPTELNESFSFSPLDVRNFTLHTRDGLKKLWVIAVNSPELEALREKYGCSPRLKDRAFHITLGKQLPSAPENWKEVDSFSPYNFSDEPTQGLFSNGDFVKVEHQSILETAAKVNAVGQLHLKKNGYVYLDISNKYVEEIVGQLPVTGEFKALSTNPKKIGAHISVIYEDEMIGNEIWDLAEAGEWFTFNVKELRYVDRNTSKGQKRLWLLAADAPALERLRVHYGLKPKLLSHDFHITLGSEQLQSPFAIIENQDDFYENDVIKTEPADEAA